jgi:hypothetical protein
MTSVPGSGVKQSEPRCQGAIELGVARHRENGQPSTERGAEAGKEVATGIDRDGLLRFDIAVFHQFLG